MNNRNLMYHDYYDNFLYVSKDCYLNNIKAIFIKLKEQKSFRDKLTDGKFRTLRFCCDLALRLKNSYKFHFIPVTLKWILVCFNNFPRAQRYENVYQQFHSGLRSPTSKAPLGNSMIMFLFIYENSWNA